MTNIDYMFPPNIEFDEDLDIGFQTRTKLKEVLIQALFLNNITIDKINKINIRSTQFFDIKIIDEIISIGIPNSLSYDICTYEFGELEEFFWCEDKYERLGITITYKHLHITRDQLLFIFCHELNHYLNGDLGIKKSLMSKIFLLTTNIFVLLLLWYFFNIFVVFIVIGWNHLYTFINRMQEQKADIGTFNLKKDMNKYALSLWKQLKEYKYKNNLAKILGICIRWYKRIICGRTHPTYDERILYSS